MAPIAGEAARNSMSWRFIGADILSRMTDSGDAAHA